MTEPLDRPIWHALTGRQSAFAIGQGTARRFRPDVSPFIACRDDGAESLSAVAPLLGERDAALFLQVGEILLPPGCRRIDGGRGVQMVAEHFEPGAEDPEIVALSPLDVAAMLDLATLTQPGPFRSNTHEIAQFWGIKDRDGRLLAMAGERLRLPGMSEVSGVCTHPDARGRGYAERLSKHVAGAIVRRGETPFLHAYADNHRAISLYERLGFRHRTFVEALVVGRI